MIDLLIAGKLPLRVDGQMELPRTPPFPAVHLPSPAALVTVALDPGMHGFVDVNRLFAAWYDRHGAMGVMAGDGAGTWIGGLMRCIGMEVHDGIQTTVSVLPPPRWRTDEWGNRVPYNPQPTFRRITKPVNQYVLAAWRYEFCGPPEMVVPAAAELVLH